MQQSILFLSNSSSGTAIGLGRTMRIITEMGHLPHLVVTGIDTSPGQKTIAEEQFLLPAESIIKQTRTTLNSRIINAVLLGVYGDESVLPELLEALSDYKAKKLIPIIANPCLPIDEQDADALAKAADNFLSRIAPISDLITPSIREAEALTGLTINTPEAMTQAAEKLLESKCQAVFMHGGNFQENQTIYQLVTEGAQLTFSAPRLMRKIPDRRQGFGSVLAAAIGVCLAKGQNYEASIERALVQMKRMALSEL